ncbi:MAG TPA: hypothetical protein VGN05_08205 [Parvibaculum sp.]|jgi:hypothetical protein
MSGLFVGTFGPNAYDPSAAYQEWLGGPSVIGRRILIGLVFIFLTACSAHNPMILRNTTTTKPIETAHTYAAHKNKVWITKAELPAGTKYEALETVDVGSKWYGGADKADLMLANRARAIGADAVIRVSTWHQPSGFSWSAPHGHGEAVKLLDPKSVDLTKLEGNWY